MDVVPVAVGSGGGIDRVVAVVCERGGCGGGGGGGWGSMNWVCGKSMAESEDGVFISLSTSIDWRAARCWRHWGDREWWADAPFVTCFPL